MTVIDNFTSRMLGFTHSVLRVGVVTDVMSLELLFLRLLLFLDAFAKLAKATVSSAMSVYPPSVRMEKLGFHWT